MGVDPKRPLAGFALVAVLCAVLMSVSVNRGWSLDFVQAGKPIAASAEAQVERAPVPVPDTAEPAEVVDVVEVGFPVELVAPPLAAAATTRATQPVAKAAVATKAKLKAKATAPRTTTDDAKTDRKADRAAAREARKAAHAAARAERKADRDAAKAERKAQRKADKAAAKAERDAEKAARKG